MTAGYAWFLLETEISHFATDPAIKDDVVHCMETVDIRFFMLSNVISLSRNLIWSLCHNERNVGKYMKYHNSPLIASCMIYFYFYSINGHMEASIIKIES